ncbi:hypothetical protein K449DRAFT_330914 [Hypoxylon sp. EC38]|nr:hypothetical protein K449DRAFT_330914 [Hypoxylon sp. EC38]
MRRAHRKSKYGCKNCKQRHLKCDEARPSCNNCLITDRTCSFLELSTTLPVNLSGVPLARSPSSTSHSPTPNRLTPPKYDGPQDGSLGERYSLVHLELLHHFQSGLVETLGSNLPDVIPMIHHCIQEAFRTPYLMDELLALSAAHKSTLAEDRSSLFQTEATRLQTRALAQFNAANTDISDENYLAMFLFSVFLGHHVLFDTFSCLDNLSTVLDKFVQCLSLHRGICAIASQSWSNIESQIYPNIPIDSTPTEPSQFRQSDECAGLVELIQSGELSSSASQACRGAIDALQHIFDKERSRELPATRRITVIQEWPVRISTTYIELLDQRRPEALVILAHYAVLLHRARDYWAVGDAGSFLIRSIARHLGSYWDKWLQWPKQVGLSVGTD